MCVFFFNRCEPYRLNFTALPYANPGDRWLIACVVPPASVSGTNTSGSISPIGGSNARMKDNPAIVADLVEVSLSFYFRIGNSTDVVFFYRLPADSKPALETRRAFLVTARAAKRDESAGPWA